MCLNIWLKSPSSRRSGDVEHKVVAQNLLGPVCPVPLTVRGTSFGGRGTLSRIEVEVAVARVDRQRAARRTRFVDKRTAAWARIALMWVRKRCYEPTEPPRSLETARACRNS